MSKCTYTLKVTVPLDQLEWRLAEQDGRVQYVFETIQHLIEAPAEPQSVELKRRIGFPTANDNRDPGVNAKGPRG